MPTFSSNSSFNINPISKLLVVFLTGLTVVHSLNICFELGIFCLIGILFYLNGYKKTLFKWIILCTILYALPNFMVLSNINPILFHRWINLKFQKIFPYLLLLCLGSSHRLKRRRKTSKWL